MSNTIRTVGDIIKSSMVIAGIIDSSESAASNEVWDALVAMNQMLDDWNLDNLMSYMVNTNIFPLIPGQSAYTIGTGGNFNIPRPNKISMASVQILNNPTMPTEVPIEMKTVDEWRDITVKNVQSTFPMSMYYEKDYPLATIYFWPVPIQVNNFVLYSEELISEYTALSQAMNLPSGYERAIKFNLAVELMLEYGKPLDPTIVSIANTSKARLKYSNNVPVFMATDPTLVRGGSRCSGGIGNQSRGYVVD